MAGQARFMIDFEEFGEGPPLLYLHGEHHFALQMPFVRALAANWRVLVPRHPGFDGVAPPKSFRRVDDLAYAYLDLLERLDDPPAFVVGSSLGGWIALEMAIRDRSRIAALAAISPLGAKFSERAVRDYADLFALPDADVASCLFNAPPDLSTFSADEMTEFAQDRQYLAYYAWKPYCHNPALAEWLHRASMRSLLVWGQDDGFIAADQAGRLAERLPNAEVCLVEGAAHYPQIECMELTAKVVSEFGMSRKESAS